MASVPFFGGGGRFGRSWGMRQSLPTSVVPRVGAARKAVQAAAHRMSWAARGGRLRALAGLAIIINETNVLCRLIGRRVASMGATVLPPLKFECERLCSGKLGRRLQASTSRLEESLQGPRRTRGSSKVSSGL